MLGINEEGTKLVISEEFIISVRDTVLTSLSKTVLNSFIPFELTLEDKNEEDLWRKLIGRVKHNIISEKDINDIAKILNVFNVKSSLEIKKNDLGDNELTISRETIQYNPDERVNFQDKKESTKNKEVDKMIKETSVTKDEYKDIKDSTRVWLLGGKDREMEEVKKLLQEHGEEYIDKGLEWNEAELSAYLESIQRFNTRVVLIGLELENDLIKYSVRNMQDHNVAYRKVGFDENLNDGVDEDHLMIVRKSSHKSPGGSLRCYLLDHHDEKYDNPSVLEQVQMFLESSLDVKQKFVAANDTGYIPAMEKLADELDISDEMKYTLIDEVRKEDRRLQGITDEHDEEAHFSLKEKTVYLDPEGKDHTIAVVQMNHSKTACVTDLLYHTAVDEIFVVAEINDKETELNYFGEKEIINKIHNKFSEIEDVVYWKGGDIDNVNGYAGCIYDSDKIYQFIMDIVPGLEEKVDHGMGNVLERKDISAMYIDQINSEIDIMDEIPSGLLYLPFKDVEEEEIKKVTSHAGRCGFEGVIVENIRQDKPTDVYFGGSIDTINELKDNNEEPPLDDFMDMEKMSKFDWFELGFLLGVNFKDKIELLLVDPMDLVNTYDSFVFNEFNNN